MLITSLLLGWISASNANSQVVVSSFSGEADASTPTGNDTDNSVEFINYPIQQTGGGTPFAHSTYSDTNDNTYFANAGINCSFLDQLEGDARSLSFNANTMTSTEAYLATSLPSTDNAAASANLTLVFVTSGLCTMTYSGSCNLHNTSSAISGGGITLSETPDGSNTSKTVFSYSQNYGLFEVPSIINLSAGTYTLTINQSIESLGVPSDTIAENGSEDFTMSVVEGEVPEPSTSWLLAGSSLGFCLILTRLMKRSK